MKTIIKNATYLMPGYKTWSTGNILIEDEKIAMLGNIPQDIKVDEVVDAKNKIVIPGFINSHMHSYTGYLKGSIDNMPLDIYMLYAIAGGSFRTPREIYISTMIEALQMLKTGTTSVVDHFSQRPIQALEGLNATANAFSDLGMKATIAPMFADLSFFDTVPMLDGELPSELRGKVGGKTQTAEEYIELVEEAAKKYNCSGNIKITLGTDGPQRCSEKLLKLTGMLEEKYKMGWHTHVLEAKTQAIVSRNNYKMGLIEYMNSMGLLNERTTLVHYIWVSDTEQNIVANRGCNIVHCPSSALHLGSGLAPMDKLLEIGTHVAIGTDGGNCGNLSMIEKIRLTALIHKPSQPNVDKWISASDALELCYNGGSRVLNNRNIGKIEEGYSADLVMINTNNVLWQPINDITTQLVYGENGSNVDTVFVAGKKVIENGKSILINEDDIILEAIEIGEKLKKDNAFAFKLLEKQVPVFKGMYNREVNKKISFNRFYRPI